MPIYNKIKKKGRRITPTFQFLCRVIGNDLQGEASWLMEAKSHRPPSSIEKQTVTTRSGSIYSINIAMRFRFEKKEPKGSFSY